MIGPFGAGKTHDHTHSHTGLLLGHKANLHKRVHQRLHAFGGDCHHPGRKGEAHRIVDRRIPCGGNFGTTGCQQDLANGDVLHFDHIHRVAAVKR